MSEYTRPSIEPVEFRDADGEVIDYGNRWAAFDGTPPEDSYSVDDHPERFAPLHTVASALIDHLVATYDVDVEEGAGVDSDGMPPEQVARAVRLAPRSSTSAPLTIVFTDYPAVRLQAGVLFSTVFPSCGCNACDERWDHGADELEWQTLAIAGGGFSERVSAPRMPKLSHDRRGGWVMSMGQTVSYQLRHPDGVGEQGGESPAKDVPKDRLAAAQSRLADVAAVSPDGSWQAWPRKKL